MLYLLDANVLITAQREYYPHHRIPEFWEWLTHISARGDVKLPEECFEEIAIGKDWLSKWVKKKANKASLLLDEEADAAIVARVLDIGYAPDLNDIEIERIGRDPFLVAYALAYAERTVVTTEVSSRAKQRANRKLPDVCRDFKVPCVSTYAMLDALKFHTGWKPPR